MDVSGQQRDPSHQAIVRQRILRFTALLLSLIVCATAVLLESTKITRKHPEPYHTSALTGEEWVIELLVGHPERIRCELGMHAHVFAQLISELRDLGHDNSRFVSLEEQLAIFLYCSVTGLTIRHVGERFQRSNDTISRYFRKMTIILSDAPFYPKYVHLPAVDEIHSKIRSNPRFWPFLRGAIGALDGSHIHITPPAKKRGLYRNRKGFLSQNCLFACNFDLLFTYALTGWEGSATDARVFQSARTKGLRIPAGRYLLGDAGFPLRLDILVPYRGVRYHLAEWQRVKLRPANKEELFNLRHASARNVIERIFGVLKRRFRILLLAPEYKLDIQARIPVALCTLHNFMRIHDKEDVEGENDGIVDDLNDRMGAFRFGAGEEAVDDEEDNDLRAARAFRDRTAEEMWTDYQRVLRANAEIVGTNLDDEDIFTSDVDEDMDVDSSSDIE